MGAELFAIDKGLTWILIHKEILLTEKCVFLTDSKAGIEAIRNSKPKHQSHIIDAIKQKAKLLSDSSIDITLQWIPSHVGVMGNEEVDDIAKRAHENPAETEAELDISEINILLKQALQANWEQKYEVEKPNLHIGTIRNKVEHWEWSNTKNRLTQTAIT